MSNYVARGNLSVARELADFVDSRLLKDGGITADSFWTGFDAAVHRLAPRNHELLAIREDMQARIDSWLRDQAGTAIDAEAYTAFLSEIGYLVEEPAPFGIGSENVDAEVARMAGPQLVVPILNARFLLNAAKALFWMAALGPGAALFICSLYRKSSWSRPLIFVSRAWIRASILLAASPSVGSGASSSPAFPSSAFPDFPSAPLPPLPPDLPKRRCICRYKKILYVNFLYVNHRTWRLLRARGDAK